MSRVGLAGLEGDHGEGRGGMRGALARMVAGLGNLFQVRVMEQG